MEHIDICINMLLTTSLDKKTITGKRKDYWEYFCECLAPLKGVNDGIKYVKTTGDVSLFSVVICFMNYTL